MKIILLISLTLTIGFVGRAQKKGKQAEEKSFSASTISGLKFRSLGPALTSGRIADIAVHPENHNIWYVAAASGGVWKTNNHGTTFNPIFDSYGSYSIACVELAPSNPSTVWVGTGENNNQRSVAYGDGVYKSLDGGASFKNMGLKSSEHIGNIIVHPTNENIVWVAAYGPVWSEGGERGVYMTTDGGTTWIRTLEISKHTGIAEIAIDPDDPKILYASAHQRRRREWTYIGGGPESGLYKSNDGGKTWREINNGLPKGQMGRIGIAVSPANANYVYAIVEAREGKEGFFRSTNKGESWSKMSSYKTSGNYYQEIICDRFDVNKVFSMNTYLHHTIDGGKNFKRTGERTKHVDNHCIWIDPKDKDHWIVGCDGGIYETFNHAKQWKFYNNLPVTQFYKVATDNELPFYNIYGGTQDNWSMGGPSATNNNNGILNSDWFITRGGDGFESAIDPVDPNTVYAQSQYGGLIRFNKKTGERISIKPLPEKGENGYRWNWDAPLLISPHDHNTLYFCANKVFKSTNQGDDWNAVSDDLSQQIDRNKLPVMGQVWGIDAVMKNMSTTIYGNIVAFDESPKRKGLLYAGTDDGLVQVSSNGGENWTKRSSFPGVPSNTRVNMIIADLHDENTVYAAFNNHRSGDFMPYLMKSTDQGESWTSIAGNLPDRGSVFAIRQDHIDPNLIFVGTEFGCFFSNDGGGNWTKITGLPTIAIYDIDIQKRENDIVVASFGRGFYVLDDYTPLRSLTKEIMNKEAHLFPIKDAKYYIEASPLGSGGNAYQGNALWRAENPEYGATFSIYIKKLPQSLKSERKDADKKKEKSKEITEYPSFDQLRSENNEDKPKLIWIIRNALGKEIKRISTAPQKGINRISWNFRTTTKGPVEKNNYGGAKSWGLIITPGTYTVEVYSIKDGIVAKIIDATSFNVVDLYGKPRSNQLDEELMKFRTEISETYRLLSGSEQLMTESKEKLELLENAVRNYPGADLSILVSIERLKTEFSNLDIALNGDKLRSKYQFETTPSIYDRFSSIYYQLYNNTRGVTKTQRKNKVSVEEEYTAFRSQLNAIVVELKTIETQLESIGIPYLKGNDENWKED